MTHLCDMETNKAHRDDFEPVFPCQSWRPARMPHSFALTSLLAHEQ